MYFIEKIVLYNITTLAGLRFMDKGYFFLPTVIGIIFLPLTYVLLQEVNRLARELDSFFLNIALLP